MSNAQQRIVMILKSLGIPIELCDISAPGMEVTELSGAVKLNLAPGAAGLHEGQRHQEGGAEEHPPAPGLQRREILRGELLLLQPLTDKVTQD